MKVKRKIRRQAYTRPLAGRAARRPAKSGNWFKQISTFVVATGFSYYNKAIAWRHALMDGLP